LEIFIKFRSYFIGERPDSPISELEIDSNINKPKWEIRLPELLNSMVGPDRQVNIHQKTNFLFDHFFLET
jgi:hypothetical protein